MEVLEYIAIPGISLICYLIASVYKAIVAEEHYRHIPVIVMVSGLIIAILAFIYIDDYINVENVIEAGAVGIVSGLGATGLNQLIKKVGGE